jgi:hypothetical protein
MEQHESEYIQLDFFHLLPGSAGGRALRALKGNDYFAELARSAAAQRSKEERQTLAGKSACERRRRLYTIPRTVRYVEVGFLVTERIVPWWPHQRNRQRRKRPVFVHIELERVPMEAMG